MNAITRNVKDLDSADRQAIEHVLGQQLDENQQLMIRVVSLDLSAGKSEQGSGGDVGLPAWCDIYSGLTDAEVDDIERSIVRTPGNRDSA